MKIYKELLQQSEEWFLLKYGKIGGSTLKKLMVDKDVRDCAIYDELLSTRFEPFELEEMFTSNDMERGNIYEPLARMEYERVYEKKVTQYGWIEMDNGIAGLSPDGIIGKRMAEAIEIKCPNRVTHTAYLRNPMLMIQEYIWQIVMYFTVLKNLKTLHFISYRPENTANPLLVYDVTPDTVVQLSKKDISNISSLVMRTKDRLSLLRVALEQDTARFTPKF
ncbi:YqaJ viral recombinase family protein [Dysgonomonas sp. 25]|uniref:YqaJ viral recombinase family protein n=1 Tax=Dysgonomonas sp. 25 TaxID=2302933 RepID=UPI0013D83136|nr:YqaJ viral recombinase family protein [Dysgonomonas sp. 25]NDV68561.1 hypothetical protein [Dysgonomonas sp. 25]